MELSTEDKQRIEREYHIFEFKTVHDTFGVSNEEFWNAAAEYATLYERQQLDKFIVYKDLKTGEMMARYEAERSELRNKVIEEIKTELMSQFIFTDPKFSEINETLNSLKTK